MSAWWRGGTLRRPSNPRTLRLLQSGATVVKSSVKSHGSGEKRRDTATPAVGAPVRLLPRLLARRVRCVACTHAVLCLLSPPSPLASFLRCCGRVRLGVGVCPSNPLPSTPCEMVRAIPARSHALPARPHAPTDSGVPRQLRAVVLAAAAASALVVVRLSSQPALPTAALGWGRDAFGLYNYGAPRAQQQVACIAARSSALRSG